MRRCAVLVHPSMLLVLSPCGRRVCVVVINHRHLATVAALHRVARASAAGGGGWPLSGGWRGLEARGGAQRARERAPEAARPPAPALGSRAGESVGSGGASERPAETSPAGCGRHAPRAGIGALLGVRLVVPVGLLDGLTADAECVADLGPGGSVAAGGGGQKIACIGECVLGVSHRFQGFQGPLRTPLRGGKALDRSAYSVARCGGFLGAHVNGYWHRSLTVEAALPSIAVDGTICDTSFPYSAASRVGSSLSDISAIRYRPTTEKKRPRAAPTAGVMDASGATDDDGSSLRS